MSQGGSLNDQKAIEFNEAEPNVIHVLERNMGAPSRTSLDESKIHLRRNSVKHTFKFDRVCKPATSQKEVYELAAGV